MVLFLFLIFEIIFCEPLFGGNFVSDSSLRHFEQMSSVFVAGEHRCGGTLINKNWVLTASHCFLNLEDDIAKVTVILGVNDVRHYVEEDHILSDIIIIHKNYNSAFLRDDIALVHLSKPSEVTSFPYVIPKSYNIHANPNCEISGFGSTSSFDKNTLLLYNGKTKVISRNECASSMSVMLARNTVCTKNRGTAPCGGDSGGPLICGRYLIGVISHGPVCHIQGMPSVYSFTPRYKRWIERATSSHKALESKESL